MFLNVTTAHHRNQLLVSLGCSREPWILSRFLSMLLDDKSGLRKQDGRTVFAALSGNAIGARIAFEFYKKNFDQLMT